MTEEKKQPIVKVRDGNLSVAGFLNEHEVDGQKRKFISCKIQRGYKDKDDNWQNTDQLSLNDLPRAALLLQQAYAEGKRALAEELKGSK